MKKYKFILFTLLSAIFIIALNSCDVDPVIKNELPANDIHLVIPNGWPYPHYNFTGNVLTKDGFILGRKLFYDPQLSRNNTISCGSCHQHFAAFSHLDHKVSHGIDGKLGNRNAPALFNLNWQTNFMWDGGVNHIEVQPLGPISNPVEMDQSIVNAVNKIQNDVSYSKLFKDAFGTEKVTSQLILKALAQFMGMLVSSNSKYDLYKQGLATLNASELNGLNIFLAKCNTCHTAPLFTNFQYKNNGLDTVYKDPGRGRITLLEADSGTFKVPSLRNVALTRPYMHDGRFNTLSQVLDHYVSGVKNSSTLSSELIGGVILSPLEKLDIISFLNTLSDNTFIHDARFNDPFAP